MPKTPSKASKKKKFNSRFPPARIKKIMQTDEEVGKVAAAVPVIISRALELFLESFITETSQTTIARNAKTLSTSHIKQTIETNKQFDFLRGLVADLPDHNTEESNGDPVLDNGDVPPKRKRGRPKKNKDPLKSRGKKRGESSKASPETSEEEEEEDEEDEEEDATETEDDDDKAGKSVGPPSYLTAKNLTKASTLAPTTAIASNHQAGASSSSSTVSHTAAQNNSGSTTVTKAGAQNLPPHIKLFFGIPLITRFPPGYSLPPLSSLNNQQAQLQLHQQMQAHHQLQQQAIGNNSIISPSSSLPHPLYLPPAPLSSLPSQPSSILLPSSGVEGYPIPPQFHSGSQFPVAGPLPPAHQPLPFSLQPRPMGFPVSYAGLHLPTMQEAVHSQAHPINLSMVSQGTHAANSADDYDS